MIDLIIGRESGVENPRLAIEQNGTVSYWGKPGSVPKSVSRKHCHVVIDDSSRMTIEDITPNNYMYVNGQDCKRKGNVSFADTVELGQDRYRLELERIVMALSSNQVYNIASLKKVFESYQKEKFDIQVKQGKLNAISALPGILSMISIGVAVFFEKARIIMIIIAGVFALFFAYIRYRNATKIPLKIKKIEDSFRDTYTCPNPVCGRFLGATPYKELLRNKACPFCKAKFSD